ELLGLLHEAVAHEAGGGDGAVVGPYRPAVVADGVVPPHARGQGAHAPSREHLRGHQVPGDQPRLLLVDDPGPKAVAHVRRQRIDLALVAVEADGDPALVLHPEVPVEGGLEIGRLLGVVPARLLVACLVGEVVAGQVGAVDVGLDLAEGYGGTRHRPVRVADDVPRVLPALVGQDPVRTALIYDV